MIFMLKFRHFQSIELEIRTRMVGYIFNFHQTKLIGPCKSFPVIYVSITLKKKSFLLSWGGQSGDFTAKISLFRLIYQHQLLKFA